MFYAFKAATITWLTDSLKLVNKLAATFKMINCFNHIKEVLASPTWEFAVTLHYVVLNLIIMGFRLQVKQNKAYVREHIWLFFCFLIL